MKERCKELCSKLGRVGDHAGSRCNGQVGHGPVYFGSQLADAGGGVGVVIALAQRAVADCNQGDRLGNADIDAQGCFGFCCVLVVGHFDIQRAQQTQYKQFLTGCGFEQINV